MRTIKSFSILVTIQIMSTIAFAQTGKAAVDYLSVPGPIQFNSKAYVLNWSAHPAATFYKQEYLAKGEITGKYNTMVLMDVTTAQQEVKSVVAAKIAELKQMKEGNPIVNYEAIQNPSTGEYMIDFLLTANGPDGNISIVERNVYRYKTFIDKSGQKGVLLFGVSTRGYGPAVNQFIASLKTNRKDLVNKVSQMKLPEVSVKKS